MESLLAYREVIPDQTYQNKLKDIILTKGGSQSTLQDIKVPEKAGGFVYNDALKYFTRNRFIYWRIAHDILELVEHSFDLTLMNNQVKYKFSDTPLLDGISIHETIDSVIILVATVSSVHKLSFPHPRQIHKQDTWPNESLNVQSIFSETLIQNSRDPYIFRVIPSAGHTNSPVAHAATSWLLKDEALFALAYSTGTILIVCLNIVSGLIITSEIKQETIVPRFLSGIATALRGRTTDIDIPMSLVAYSCNSDFYLFALYREGHLRMWSCNKSQCISDVEIINNNYSLDYCIQNYGLKKFIDFNNDLYLCTYLKSDIGCEFCILKLVCENGVYTLIKISTLSSTDQHLVDFSFTTFRLWAVWKTTEFDKLVVKHVVLPNKNQQLECKWELAVLENSLEKDFTNYDPSIDPRQAYINYLFEPGKYSLLDITKALNIYQKINISNAPVLSLSTLKERVCAAVETEIQAEIIDYELSDEDYLEIVNRCWSKFYLCVQQYHGNGSRPVGLLLLPNVHGIILLKKSSFSVLRPMEALEQLMFCNDKSYSARLKNISRFTQDDSMCQDIVTLVSALIVIEERLTDDFKYFFKKELHQLNSPDLIVQKLLSKFMFELDGPVPDFDFQTEICQIIENIQDISKTFTVVLGLLTYDPDDIAKTHVYETFHKSPYASSNIDYYFTSQVGVSVISKTVLQMNIVRFSFCRNLLILQQIILSRPELFDSQSLYSVKSTVAPKTVVLTQAYYATMWICECAPLNVISQNSLENSFQRLSILKDTDCMVLKKQQQASCSLLELFIQYGIKKQKFNLVGHTDNNTSNIIYWHYGMLKYVKFISQVIWPISEDFYFPEWLLFSCQFPLVQEYVRILSTWCEWNGTSRKFILAVSFLEMGETQKACDYFLRAFNGVIIENYLSELFLTTDKIVNNVVDNYFLKVIKIFEQYNASDCIIELATTAITVAEKYGTNLPTFYSIVFTQHLDLQHHIEAYNYLNTNPDVARRVDCLRQLVVTLFNRNKLLDLLEFPYVDMYHDMEKIMEDRGRSADIKDNNYYNFLYSFHLNKGNMRKASSTMYEQAVRFNQEIPTLFILTRQSQCYLACINALQLVNERYRWIVRPVFEKKSLEENYCSTEDKILNSNEILQYKVIKRIEVLELEDIKKECFLCEAKLKLIQLNPDICIPAQTNPLEITTLLSRVGLFCDALEVTQIFNLNANSILENLASECVKLNYMDNTKTWKWLYLNDISDLCISTVNPSHVAWKLLENLLIKHEKRGESNLHKAVTKKLYQLGAFLPRWLFYSYAERNSAEFLRLMVKMGRLEEATHFSMDIIKTILSGKGNKYFNLSSNLLATASPVSSPFNIIEILLYELESAAKDDEYYLQLLHLLRNSTNNYLRTVKCVSENMVALKMK